MLIDICSCETSLTRPDVLDNWNAMIKAFLAHGAATPEHLGAVLDAEPDFAMIWAAKGLFSIMLGRRELYDVAQDADRKARAALSAGGATRREQLWCEALSDWLAGRPSAAIAHMEEALRLNPADTLSMKVSHAIRFILGDNHGMRRSVETVMGAHGGDHPLRGYALGCLSFALEETGSYRDAELTGLQALEFAQDDAWGLHAVAHVYDMTHRPEHGIALIDQNAPAWGHCNNFRFHVWWHKALLHLDRGEYDYVLDLYDTKIRSEKTDDYRDFSNASSLLIRLELEGMNVGKRWEELSDLADRRSTDGCLAFADLHYMLALAGDKRPDASDQLIARLERDAKGQQEAERVMHAPGIEAAKGLSAFGNADYVKAYRHLAAARPLMQTVGGSHAQRDVFERITIEASIRAGRVLEAQQMLQERVRLRGGAEDAFATARLQRIANIRAIEQTVAAQ